VILEVVEDRRQALLWMVIQGMIPLLVVPVGLLLLVVEMVVPVERLVVMVLLVVLLVAEVVVVEIQVAAEHMVQTVRS
jgi:hypothetical protein